MELRHIEYFVKTAELNNISRAAECFNIMQPSLSKAISLLEAELGVKLFDRIGRRIQLNDNGRLFLNSAKGALSMLEDGTFKMKRMGKTPVGHVKIGIFSASNIVPNCLAEYARYNPYVRFSLRTTGFQLSDDSERYHMLSDFDLIFYNSGSRLNVHVENIPIITETYVAIMSKQHPLAKRQSLLLSDLADSPFVAYHQEEIDQTYQFCMEAGFAPNIAYETDNTGLKPDLINAGAAVGIIPEICITEYKVSYPNIAFVSIKEPVCKRTVYLGWKSDNYLTVAAKSFKDFAVNYYSNFKSKEQP